MRFLKSETSGSDEPFELGRLSGKVLVHECHFVNHSLPSLLPPFAGPEDLEHLIVRHGLHLFNRHFPLASLLLPFLLDHITQYLRSIHFVSVQQICWDSSILNLLLVLHCRLLFFMGLNVFLHLYLLLVPLLGI